MSDLSRAQSSALFKMFNDQVPLNMSVKTATALQAKGYAMQAKVFPTPMKGHTMAITTKGRSYCLTKV